MTLLGSQLAMGSVFPAKCIDRNIMWTASGEVWAVWLVQCETFLFLSEEQKRLMYHRQVDFLETLPTSSHLISVCRYVSAEEMVERQTSLASGHNGTKRRAASLAAYVENGLTDKRMTFIAVQLESEASTRFERGIQTFMRQPWTVPTSRQREARHRQATETQRWLEAFSVVPASTTDLRWLIERTILRGTTDSFFEMAHRPVEDSCVEVDVAAGSVFYPAGERTDPGRVGPRYIKVQPSTGIPVYTKHLVMSLPKRTWGSIDSEILLAVDNLPYPVDWSVRIEKAQNKKAVRRASQKAQHLAAQFEEYPNHSQPPSSLAEAERDVEELYNELEANPDQTLNRTTLQFNIAGPDLEDLEAQAIDLERFVRLSGGKAVAPTGQIQALQASQVGASAQNETYRHYSAELLCRGLAAFAPLATLHEVGSPKGFIIGLAGRSPVYFSPSWGPVHGDQGGNVCYLGMMGEGKSNDQKLDLANLIYSGSKVVVIDQKSADGKPAEYVPLAQAFKKKGYDCQIVTVHEQAVSLNPLQIFPDLARAKDAALAFIGSLCGLGGTSVELAQVGAVVDQVLQGQNRSMKHLIAMLSASEIEEVQQIGLLLDQQYARSSFASSIFGNRPAPQLDGDFIVFDISGLPLPKKTDNDAELSAKQRYARAVLYLIADASFAAISSSDRYGQLVIDEAAPFLENEQGRTMVEEAMRRGRDQNHQYGVSVSSQLGADMFRSEIAKLFQAVFLHRIASDEGVIDALRLMGIEATTRNIRRVQQLNKGECLFKDPLGRVAVVQRLLEPDDELRVAANTGKKT